VTVPRGLAQNYWVVIPGYNEAATVRAVASRAIQQCPNVVVVDDGSTDGTAEALAGLDVTVLRNAVNLGKGESLARGFDHALSHGAVGVITLDADGQHAPEEIPLFLEQAKEQPTALLIGARRRDQRRLAYSRYVANRIADFWIGWAAGLPIEDSQSGFRLYPGSLLHAKRLLFAKAKGFVFESEIVIEASRHGIPCRNVEVTVQSRGAHRLSHFRPLQDILGITRMVAWKLLSRGFYLQGLWSCLTSPGMKYGSISHKGRVV
jgi:glycosyltransferase involved in cell wall biosynthesis